MQGRQHRQRWEVSSLQQLQLPYLCVCVCVCAHFCGCDSAVLLMLRKACSWQ
jgi:hypothetical protein